jgi:hypothetical protein
MSSEEVRENHVLFYVVVSRRNDMFLLGIELR